jgi:hypothetical protein
MKCPRLDTLTRTRRLTGVIRHMRDNGLSRAECTPAGVADWTDHVKALGEGLLSNEIDSWMTGINRNVEGKTERIIARYSGSAPAYRTRCDAVAKGGSRDDALITASNYLSGWKSTEFGREGA